MGLKHKVRINITRPDGRKDAILRGGSRSIRSKLLNYLLGEKMNVLVISPGDSVQTVEIKELDEKGGGANEPGSNAAHCCV